MAVGRLSAICMSSPPADAWLLTLASRVGPEGAFRCAGEPDHADDHCFADSLVRLDATKKADLASSAEEATCCGNRGGRRYPPDGGGARGACTRRIFFATSPFVERAGAEAGRTVMTVVGGLGLVNAGAALLIAAELGRATAAEPGRLICAGQTVSPCVGCPARQ